MPLSCLGLLASLVSFSQLNGYNSFRNASAFRVIRRPLAQVAFPTRNSPPPPSPSVQQHMTAETCVVCFDEASHIALVCAHGHHVCSDCASGLVEASVSTLAAVNDLETLAAAADDDAEYRGRIRCPCAKVSAGGCTAPYYSDAAICKVVNETTFEGYLGARALLPIAKSTREAFEEAQSALKPEEEDDSAASSRGRVLLGKQLKHQMPDARMCKQCNFGPVDHMKCSDLAAHHGQVLEDGSVIDNSCRRCGWFSAEHADWPLWDGKIHDDHKVGHKETVELLASSLEAAEAAAKGAEEKLALARRTAQRDASEAAALRAAREKDRVEIASQSRMAKALAVQKSKLEDQLQGMKAAEARRNKAAAAAAMARLAEERGYTRIEPAAAQSLLAPRGPHGVHLSTAQPPSPSAALPLEVRSAIREVLIREVRTPSKLAPLPPSTPQPPNPRPRSGGLAAFTEKRPVIAEVGQLAMRKQAKAVERRVEGGGPDAWDRAGLPWGEVARMDRIEELRRDRARRSERVIY